MTWTGADRVEAMHDDTPPASAPAERAAPRIVDSAEVSPEAEVGEGSSVWHLAQVREGARIGRDCVIGRGAYIGSGVVLGDACKVQNHALVYEPARLAAGVFIGPAVVLTNDRFPRAVNQDLTLKSAHDWEPVGVTCEEGASIGARAVCVAPVTIGAWSMVAAGATVVHDVPPHALVAGVPARRIAWVGRVGEPLRPAADGTDAWVCPATGDWYVPDETTGGLRHAQDATRSSTATGAADGEPELPAYDPSAPLEEEPPSAASRARGALERLTGRSDRHDVTPRDPGAAPRRAGDDA